MQNEIVQNRQIDVFANELLRLKPDLTAKDREEAMKALKIDSRCTISNYLNGKVRDTGTAAELIIFFKGRIAMRNLVLLDNQVQTVSNGQG